MANLRQRTGETRVLNQGMKATIIEYRNANDIDIQFEDGYIKTTRYCHFKSGRVINPYIPTVYGVGYIGEENTVDEYGKHVKAYKVWHSMMKRCYSIKYQEYQPTYKGCTVCEEWHFYGDFKKWFDTNYYEVENEVMHLDKDILVKGNKVYSPNTCIFVPQSINCLFSEHDTEISRGVTFRKDTKKYTAHISIENIRTTLGCYNTKEEAELSFIKARKEYVEKTLKKYENKIPLEIYDKLKRGCYNEFES